ncbi:hypothetical protein [Bacillus smithii]|uniref:hypothetical protein n=1 Tax=Bacillus smithii TaxID=1479 RepID=UPI002E1FAADE|nr:hypothetical protein [Bacillus smithii]MED1456644.1 hypothetical protein [Bacillus smithii]
MSIDDVLPRNRDIQKAIEGMSEEVRGKLLRIYTLARDSGGQNHEKLKAFGKIKSLYMKDVLGPMINKLTDSE